MKILVINKKNIDSIIRYVLPFCVAIMLTFMRGGFLFFSDQYTVTDRIINITVVFIAAIMVIRSSKSSYRREDVKLYIPLMLYLYWIIIHLIMAWYRQPVNASQIITITVAIVLSINMRCSDLLMLRRSLVLINILFIIMLAIYSPNVIRQLSGGAFGVNERFGQDHNPTAFVAYPRSMYILSIACIGSSIIEKNMIVKAISIIISAVPMLIGLSTAGRGGLLGFITSITIIILGAIMVYGSKRKISLLFLISFLCSGVYYIYKLIITRFPIMVYRIQNDADDGRYDIWSQALNDITLFGKGPSYDYAHNLFLESLHDYGIIGFVLCILFVYTVIKGSIKTIRGGLDMEIIIVMAIVMLQFVTQQLSLNIYWGFFWAAMVLPISLSIEKRKIL
jgi:O-antigen ligase